MRRRDLLLIASAISAGLLAASTKSSSPNLSTLATIATGMTAYLATSPRFAKKPKEDETSNKK